MSPRGRAEEGVAEQVENITVSDNGPEEPVHVVPSCRRFAPALEAEFLASAAPAALRNMRRGLLVPALFGIAMIGMAGLSGRSAVEASLMIELLLNLPVAVLGLTLLPRIRSVGRREAVFMAAATVRVASLTAEGHWAAPAQVVEYVIIGGMAMVSMLLMVPLRLPQAVRFVVIAFPIYLFVVLVPFGGMDARWSLLAFMAMQLPPALTTRERLEASERRDFLLAIRDRTQVQQLARANEQLLSLTDTDPLTAIGNRRSFERVLARALETGAPVCLLLVDVDHFKRFNDSAGHLQGDECLQQVARAMREAVRAPDHVARFGGEEFAVVLPGAAADYGIMVAERIRCCIEALALPHAGRPDELRVVTVSIGVAVDARSRNELVVEADQALYAAKGAGRNCVRFLKHCPLVASG